MLEIENLVTRQKIIDVCLSFSVNLKLLEKRFFKFLKLKNIGKPKGLLKLGTRRGLFPNQKGFLGNNFRVDKER